MRVIKQEVLEKMSFERLKVHRRAVLAHIGSHFYEYSKSHPNAQTYRTPVNRDSDYFQYCINYRDQVNHYYDKKKPK